MAPQKSGERGERLTFLLLQKAPPNSAGWSWSPAAHAKAMSSWEQGQQSTTYTGTAQALCGQCPGCPPQAGDEGTSPAEGIKRSANHGG